MKEDIETIIHGMNALQYRLKITTKNEFTNQLREFRENIYLENLEKLRKYDMIIFAKYKNWYKLYKGIEEL